jgi:uncharacterized protein YhaN
MRIVRAHLSSYRGTADREIEFDAGVTVVEGPNEVGKSSIAEALDLLFRFKDSSKHRAVKGTIPVDRDESPLVEFEIESGPYRFVYRKQFGKGSKTELEISRPKPENLVGDPAHDRAEQILAETLDIDLWRALQVGQGVGIDQATLSDSAALSRALDQASGSTSSGADEGGLFERVQQEHERYFTPKGRPRSELADGARAIEELEADLQVLETRQRALGDDIAENDRLVDRLQTLDEQIPSLEKARAERDEALGEVSELSQQADHATTELNHLKLAADRLTTARDRRQALVDKLAASEARVTDLQVNHADVLAPLETLRQQAKAAKDGLTAARTDLEMAEALHALRDGDEKYLHAKLEAAQLAERHERVAGIRQRMSAARTTLETNQVPDEELQPIVEADIEVRQLQRRLQEAGPQIITRALGDVTVMVDDEPVALTSGAVDERAIATSTTITIPDQVELTVTPGASAEQLEGSLQNAKQELRSHLARHTVESVQAARDANAARNQAERELDDAQSRIEEDLRDLTFEQLEAKRDSRRMIVQQHEASRAQEPPLPDHLGAARDLAAEAGDKAADARQQDRAAADRVTELADQVQGQSGEEVRLGALIEAAIATASTLREELLVEREEASDDDLKAAIDSAEADVDRAQAYTTRLDSKRDAANPEQVRARRDSAKAALDAGQKERADLRENLSGIQGRLEVHQEEGWFEKEDAVRSRLDQQQTAHARLQRRSNAARLLYTTLSSHRDKARSRYLAPLTSKIEELGRVVFDSSLQVNLTDDLTIESRTLRGSTIPFDSLSKGAQEQLGLIARLAVAMIVSGDEGVPLILDDTLGYADQSRMETMAATIARAGKHCQVIVLTCSPDRFRGIPGARVERLTHGS